MATNSRLVLFTHSVKLIEHERLSRLQTPGNLNVTKAFLFSG